MELFPVGQFRYRHRLPRRNRSRGGAPLVLILRTSTRKPALFYYKKRKEKQFHL